MNSRNYKLVTLAVLVFLFFNLKTTAQVGIGTSSPNANAMLDVVATDKGFLPPRMTTAQKTDLVAFPVTGAEAGMLVYDIDLGEYSMWDGTAWVAIGGAVTPTTRSIGNIYVSTPGITPLSTSGGVQIGGGTTIINSTDFDDNGGANNNLRYIGADPKVFSVNASLTFTRFANVGTKEAFDFYVTVGGSASEEPGVIASLSVPAIDGGLPGDDELHDVSLTGTVSLSNGDFVQVFARNLTAGTIIIVSTMNIVLNEQ